VWTADEALAVQTIVLDNLQRVLSLVLAFAEVKEPHVTHNDLPQVAHSHNFGVFGIEWDEVMCVAWD